MLLAALHGHAWIGETGMQLAGLDAVLQATGELLQQCCLRCQASSSAAATLCRHTQCCSGWFAPAALVQATSVDCISAYA
jgi:ribosomal protein L40E